MSGSADVQDLANRVANLERKVNCDEASLLESDDGSHTHKFFSVQLRNVEVQIATQMAAMRVEFDEKLQQLTSSISCIRPLDTTGSSLNLVTISEDLEQLKNIVQDLRITLDTKHDCDHHIVQKESDTSAEVVLEEEGHSAQTNTNATQAEDFIARLQAERTALEEEGDLNGLNSHTIPAEDVFVRLQEERCEVEHDEQLENAVGIPTIADLRAVIEQEQAVASVFSSVSSGGTSDIHSSELLCHVDSATPGSQELQDLHSLQEVKSIKRQTGVIEAKLEAKPEKHKFKDEAKIEYKSVNITDKSPARTGYSKTQPSEQKSFCNILSASPVKMEIVTKDKNACGAIKRKVVEQESSNENLHAVKAKPRRHKSKNHEGVVNSSLMKSESKHQKNPSEDSDSTDETGDEKLSESYGVVDVVVDGSAQQDVCCDAQDDAPSIALKIEGGCPGLHKSDKDGDSLDLISESDPIRGNASSQFIMQQSLKFEPNEMFSSIYTENVTDTSFSEAAPEEPFLKKARLDTDASLSTTPLGTTVDL